MKSRIIRIVLAVAKCWKDNYFLNQWILHILNRVGSDYNCVEFLNRNKKYNQNDLSEHH